MSYHFVSIGGNCQPAHQSRRHTGRTEANVFDWLMIEPRDAARLINNDFIDFLELPNLRYAGTPFRHILDQGYNVQFVHDFKFDIELRDQYENVRSKYDYLIQRWRATMKREEPIIFLWLGPASEGDLRLLHQAIAYRRKGRPFLIVALNTGLPPGRQSACILCADIRQPEPYVWKGDDAEWERVFRLVAEEISGEPATPQSFNVGSGEIFTSDQVFQKLQETIRSRSPYSLLRVGDGEGFVLGYEDTTSEQEIENILKMWFGIYTISRRDILDIRFELAEAIIGCDMLGIHNQTGIQEKFRRSVSTIDRYGLWDSHKPVCSAEIHMQLHQDDYFSQLLRDLDFLGIITPRVVETMISEAWNIREVIRYGLPEEYHYATNGPSIGRHYPDRFHEIMRDLKVPYRGAVFLVGAGALGKIYCKRIKELGGIAIDIGSTFDAWGSHARRGNVKKMRLGL